MLNYSLDQTAHPQAWRSTQTRIETNQHAIAVLMKACGPGAAPLPQAAVCNAWSIHATQGSRSSGDGAGTPLGGISPLRTRNSSLAHGAVLAADGAASWATASPPAGEAPWWQVWQ